MEKQVEASGQGGEKVQASAERRNIWASKLGKMASGQGGEGKVK